MEVRNALMASAVVIGHLVVLAVGLALLALGIHLTAIGHWVIGPTVIVSGLVGCRFTGKAMTRWITGDSGEDGGNPPPETDGSP